MPPVAEDLTGKRFGRLTVIGRDHEAAPKYPKWLCRCQCGGEISARGDHLRAGGTRSCGCAQKYRGGVSKTREYRTWASMQNRCYNPRSLNYRFYGGIGRYICKRWRESSAAFLDDMGKIPSPDCTIDRIDTNGHYTCGKCDECREKGQPSNCRWATKHEQVRNLKNNRHYTHDGKTLILKDWARLSGVPYLVLFKRLGRGWSFEDAISKPVRKWPARG